MVRCTAAKLFGGTLTLALSQREREERLIADRHGGHGRPQRVIRGEHPVNALLKHPVGYAVVQMDMPVER